MTVYTQEITVPTLDIGQGFGAFVHLQPTGGIGVEVDFNQNGEASGVRIFMMMHNKKGHWQKTRVKPGLWWSVLDTALENEGVYAAAYQRLRATNPEFDRQVEEARG